MNVIVGFEPTILITALGRTVYLLTSHYHIVKVFTESQSQCWSNR